MPKLKVFLKKNLKHFWSKIAPPEFRFMDIPGCPFWLWLVLGKSPKLGQHPKFPNFGWAKIWLGHLRLGQIFTGPIFSHYGWAKIWLGRFWLLAQFWLGHILAGQNGLFPNTTHYHLVTARNETKSWCLYRKRLLKGVILLEFLHIYSYWTVFSLIVSFMDLILAFTLF